jgi:hypothetical protein
MDQQVKKKWYKRWWVIVLFGVIAVVLISSIGGSDTATVTRSEFFNPGEEGYLRISESNIISVLNTPEIHAQFMKAGLAKDTYGMAKIISDGGGFNVNAGTKVLVIDSEVGIRKVRVLDGEHSMKEGWVSKEFISKQ